MYNQNPYLTDSIIKTKMSREAYDKSDLLHGKAPEHIDVEYDLVLPPAPLNQMIPIDNQMVKAYDLSKTNNYETDNDWIRGNIFSWKNTGILDKTQEIIPKYVDNSKPNYVRRGNTTNFYPIKRVIGKEYPHNKTETDDGFPIIEQYENYNNKLVLFIIFFIFIYAIKQIF